MIVENSKGKEKVDNVSFCLYLFKNGINLNVLNISLNYFLYV